MFILTKKYGRLGNRLFNAAHLLALAMEYGQTFVNLSFYDYAEHFESTRNDLWCRYPVRRGPAPNQTLAKLLYYLAYNVSYLIHYLSRLGIGTRWLGVQLIRARKDAFLDLCASPQTIDYSRRSRLYLFQGWNLRCLELVEKHGDKIREYFRPTANYESAIGEFLKERREGVDLLVAVVIRHGDYRTYLGGKYYYPLETYLGWMQRMTELWAGKRVSFLVFSDEEQDTEAFRAAGLNFYFRSGHPIENLYSMAGCDYIITPPSTYGMWASFYGRTPICVAEAPGLALELESFSVYRG